ncbi:T9SS type A sorting domain-containing protein [Reichenbachiella faecimaris]|uniref:T9SS type A sorting domain-containing protein n=1 Tax=Reichenbachiella faecimaris TaxID=692418 RepID=UPI00111C8D39|nr:T9SS type A sorting domain-containing protein [Reichenbachiella faecimaris]
MATISGNTPTGLSIVEDNGNYYIYIANRISDDIVKVYLGDNLNNDPISVENLGNIDNLLDGPEHIQLVKSGNEWIAFVANFSSNSIVRLNMGESLSSNPADYDSEQISIPDGVSINSPSEIEIIEDQDNYYLFVSSRSGSTINRLDFGSSLLNNPFSGDDILVNGSSQPRSFSFDKDCDTWFGIVSSEGTGKIHQMTFNSGISNTPDVSEIALSGDAMSQPLRLRMTNDSNEFEGLIATRSGVIFRFSLGENLSSLNMSVEDLGDQSLFSNTFGFDLYFDGDEYHGFGIKSSSPRNLTRIDFSSTCGASTKTSNDKIPANIRYNQEGSHTITLRTTNNVGNIDYFTQSIVVSADISPSISFSDNANECISQPNTFTPSNTGLISYEWSFDDGTTIGSTDISPSHTFSQTGDSIVHLTVYDGTCYNFVKDTISIFPEPVTPTFFTSGSPYCTGADITFTNLFDESDYNGATLTYEWDYNGEGTSTERNGAYNFDTESVKTVTLTASIPGCTTPSAEPDLDLIAGPAVDFSVSDRCLGDDTQFTNLTEGNLITGQTWQFGDTETSTSSSPTHAYADAGDYSVTLTVTNSGGCNNVLTLPLTINDKPVASFDMGVGCEGQEVAFEDQSTINDANIESYTWDFDGLGNSTAQDPSFAFDTQGIHPVTLTVESTFGCIDEITQNVSVQSTPTADFSVDIGCLDASTQFIDQSQTEDENPINTWYWDINGDIKPNTENPSQIFNNTGTYTATLIVTPNNLCVSTVSKEFTIHELPIANFTSDNTCDNENTVFTDASTSTSTSIEAYSWQFDEMGTGTGDNEEFHFNQAGDYEVTLTITDDIGCESVNQQTITIHAAPVAAFDANRDIGPAPLTISFTNESAEAESYLWDFNDTDQSTSTETNPQFTYTELGDYEVALVSINELGCSDSATLAVTVAEPVKDLELVQISKEASDDRTNLSLTVRNNGNVAIRNFDIRIDLDHNSSVFEKYNGTLYKNQTVTFPLNFSFSNESNNIGYTCITLIDLDENYEDINLVNNEGCIDFDQKVIVENSYPNPVSSQDTQIRLNMILPTKAPVQIFLLDATGAVLYQDIYTSTNDGLNSFFIDVFSYKQGMYFIKVVYDQTESTQRFVKI